MAHSWEDLAHSPMALGSTSTWEQCRSCPCLTLTASKELNCLEQTVDAEKSCFTLILFQNPPEGYCISVRCSLFPHTKEIPELLSGSSSPTFKVNQILICIFGNKTMFKTIQISKAIWWGVRSCSIQWLPPLMYSLQAPHLQGHYSLLVFEYVSSVWARPTLSSALPEGHLSWVSPDARQCFASS